MHTVVVELSGSAASMRALDSTAARMTPGTRLICGTVSESSVPVAGTPTTSAEESSLPVIAEAITHLASKSADGGVITFTTSAYLTRTGDVVAALGQVARARCADLVIVGAGRRRG